MNDVILTDGPERTFDVDCTCPDPKLCKALRRHITGRLWEIWNGINIEPSKAEAYRQLWSAAAAGDTPETPAARPRCQHRGANPVDLIGCPGCGSNSRGAAKTRIKVFDCQVFGTCTDAVKLESVKGCCEGCPSYAAEAPVTV